MLARQCLCGDRILRIIVVTGKLNLYIRMQHRKGISRVIESVIDIHIYTCRCLQGPQCVVQCEENVMHMMKVCLSWRHLHAINLKIGLQLQRFLDMQLQHCCR